MKTAYICMDVESFYDTVCVKKTGIQPNPAFDCAEECETFLRFAEKEQIKVTFFLNVDFADRCKPFLQKAKELGHEIALHALKHVSPMEQTQAEFEADLTEASQAVKTIFGDSPLGYRAPCFGLSEEKMAFVKTHFRYDSSVLNYKRAIGSGSVDLTGFRRVNDALYEKDGFFEYPSVQRRIFGQKFPINGGGYVRMMYWPWIKRAIFKHIRQSDGYMFYVHPFEIHTGKLPRVPGLKFFERLYLRAGRKSYLKKIRKIVCELKRCGYSFATMGECTKIE